MDGEWWGHLEDISPLTREAVSNSVAWVIILATAMFIEQAQLNFSFHFSHVARD